MPDVLPNTEPQPTNPPPAPIITPPAPAIAERAAVNIQIRAIAQVAGLDQAWTDGQIDAGATVEAARTAASTVETRMAANPTLRTTRAEIIADHNDPEIRIRAAGEAVYARFTPGHQISERARQYAGLTTLDLARESLRLRSYATTGLAPAAIIERALHTTSDFPLLLGEAINRTLREAYRAAPSGLKRVGRQTTAKDFRDKHRLALSEAPRLEKVNEAGEFKSGTLAETEESYRLATYGRIIGISRQAIINDDLSAFADLARRMGQAAAATEAQLLVDLLVSNAGNGPQMSDGKPLFDAAHKNKIGSGGSAPGVASLTTGRTALRRQVGLTGELIEMEPKFHPDPAGAGDLHGAGSDDLASDQGRRREPVLVEALPGGRASLHRRQALVPDRRPGRQRRPGIRLPGGPGGRATGDAVRVRGGRHPCPGPPRLRRRLRRLALLAPEPGA